MIGSRDPNRLMHSSEEDKASNFSLGFKSLPVCIEHYNICIPIKGKYGAYALQDTRTINHVDHFLSYSLDISD